MQPFNSVMLTICVESFRELERVWPLLKDLLGNILVLMRYVTRSIGRERDKKEEFVKKGRY